MLTHRLKHRFLVQRQCLRETSVTEIYLYRMERLSAAEAMAVWQSLTWGSARIPDKDWIGWIKHVRHG